MILVFLGIIVCVKAQNLSRKALFLGNSYTFVNDLPALTAGLASASGDSLDYVSHSPGGYTLGWQPIAHKSDATSLGLIGSQAWDFVILQEQSQTPAIPALRDSCMYPASVILHDSVKSANPCARVLFFLTWGRRFGGIQCFNPSYCSINFTGFNHMQDSLTAAYQGIADSFGDWIAPVGEAWRMVLNSGNLVLHSQDDSHPNLPGSYLGACVFYGCLFGKSPVGISYTAGLPIDTALFLQQAAASIVFGQPSLWNLWNDEPKALFQASTSGDTLFTENLSTQAIQWHWDFGDNTTSGEFEPVHVYAGPGTYRVSLTACNPCFCDSVFQDIQIIPTDIPQILDPGSGIRLIGPDTEGRILFEGYRDDGLFRMYDLAGRMIGSSDVLAGTTTCSRVPQHQLCLFVLLNKEGTVVSRGKILTP